MDVTRYSDLSLKTVPTQHPIPPNSVACLYASYTYENLEAGTLFVLCRNKQELVITGPALKKTPDMEGMWEYDIVQILNKTFAEYLTIIEDLIPTVEFGLTQHAQLVPDPDTEGYQIVLDYEKQLRRVSCPTWAPIIPIEEVEFTVWGPYADRRGMWKGKEVDIFYAYNDFNMWRLNRSMHSLRHVDGHDFTFELYGHLADADGMIVGIISEAARGRMIRPSDKEFVAAELKRLESVGCLYRAVYLGHLIISDGKLRLAQWIAIRHYPDPEELRRDAAIFHTEHLDTLCQEMEDFGPNGYHRFLPDFLTSNPAMINYLRHSIPRALSERPIYYVNFSFDRPGFRAVVIYGDNHDEDDLPKRVISSRRCRPQMIPRRLIYNSPGQNNIREDAPLSSDFRLLHRVFRLARHPYGRSTLGRTLQALPDGGSPGSDVDAGSIIFTV